MSQLIPVESYEQRAEILRGNVFGYLVDSELSMEDKLLSLLNQIPLALEIVDEARSTIMRLREENERLRRV